jgi:hypothetical protein
MSFRLKLALFVALALFGIAHATGAFMLSGTAATSATGANTIMHAGDWAGGSRAAPRPKTSSGLNDKFGGPRSDDPAFVASAPGRRRTAKNSGRPDDRRIAHGVEIDLGHSRLPRYMMPLLLTSLAPALAFIGPRRNRVSIRTLLICGVICVLVSALVVPFLTW